MIIAYVKCKVITIIIYLKSILFQTFCELYQVLGFKLALSSIISYMWNNIS